MILLVYTEMRDFEADLKKINTENLISEPNLLPGIHTSLWDHYCSAAPYIFKKM